MTTGVTWQKANMVALYHFEGNSNDALGVHDGSDTDVTYVAGKFGRSASFNGTSSFFSAADHADWNFGTGNLTISFWIKMNATGTSGLVSQAQNSTNLWSLYYASGNWNWLVEIGGTNLTTFSFTPAVGRWYHVCLTKISNVYTFYIDGRIIGSNTDATEITDLAGSLYVGASSDGSTQSNFLNGYMDELVIYKGLGLTLREVKNYYAWMAGKLSRIL